MSGEIYLKADLANKIAQLFDLSNFFGGEFAHAEKWLSQCEKFMLESNRPKPAYIKNKLDIYSIKLNKRENCFKQSIDD